MAITDPDPSLMGGYQESPLVRTDPAGRIGQASQLALDADLPGAWAAMFQPESLTPAETDRLLRKYKMTGGPFESVLRTVTNPAVLVSMLLSYKFPVPTAENMFKFSKRISGMASRFPFLGRVSSAWSIFRGSDVPDTLAAIGADRKYFVEKYGVKLRSVLEEYQKTTGKLPNRRENVMLAAWLDGLHKQTRGFEGAGALMPDLERHMAGPLLAAAQQTRGVLDEMWTEAFEKLPNRKQIVKAILRQKKLGFSDDVLDQLGEWIKNPTKVPDYFPHRVLKSEEEFRALMQVLVSGTDKKATAAKAGQKIVQWLGPEFRNRQFAMVPNADDLKEVRDLIDPKAYAKMTDTVKEQVLKRAKEIGVRQTVVDKMGQMPLEQMTLDYGQWMQPKEAQLFAEAISQVAPKQYSLNAIPVMHSYANTMASTYAWTIKGGGEKMMGHLREAKGLAEAGNPHAKIRAEMLENTYLPMAMGRQDFKQAVRAQIWDQEMTKLAVRVDQPAFRNLLGDKLTDYVRDGLRQSRGSFSLLNLNRKAAAYFYVNTLSNPASALQNLTSLVYTGAVLGPKSTAIGLERAWKKSHNYFASRFRGVPHIDALRKAYPEFAEAGLAPGSIIDETLENALQNAYNIQSLPAGKLVKTSERISRAMMAMFSATEHTNRLGTFEAAMYHAERTGLKDRGAAIQFARRVVSQTQMTPGLEGTPYALLERGPLTRQFLHYPFKALEFVTKTALQLGGGEIDPKTGREKSLLGMNPGTFARLVVGSVLATELGDAVGVDIGQGTLLGGPFVAGLSETEGRPFAPIPVLPPVVQLAGAAAMGIGSGDFSALVRSTPLLVPGGVTAYRAMGLLPPSVPGASWGQSAAKWAERTYADYQAPAPDGRIALYSGKGTLRGYYTPWEVFRLGMGIRGGGPQKEQEALEMLVKNRDQVREYRQNYYDHLLTNNFRGAQEVQREFLNRFGFAMPVSEQDLAAIQSRRKMTRLEQVLQTLPPGQAREQFGSAIGAALGSEAGNMLGVSPEALSGSSQQRNQQRGQKVRPSPYLNQMGPTGSVDPTTIGRQPYPQVSRFGF